MKLSPPESMRTSVTLALEWTLLHIGAAALTRAWHRGRVLIFAFHNIVPDGAPPAAGGGLDRSLHLGQSMFRRQLELLAGSHEIVPLQTILDSGTGRRPRAVITFDDAYRGAVTAGVEELARLGMPATIFVAPAFIGGKTFWWDSFADPAAGAPAEPVRAEALERLAGQDAAVRAWAATRGLTPGDVPAHACVASEDDLRRAAGIPGVTLGSHSWSHPNLTRLGGQDLERELTRPLAWLRERFTTALPWLAYPYGLASPPVEEAAARAGYAASLLVQGGWLPRGRGALRPHALPRLNIPAGMSLNGFALRAAGVLA